MSSAENSMNQLAIPSFPALVPVDSLQSLRGRTCLAARTYVTATWDQFLRELGSQDNESYLKQLSDEFFAGLEACSLRCAGVEALEKIDWDVQEMRMGWNRTVKEKYYELSEDLPVDSTHNHDARCAHCTQLSLKRDDFRKLLYHASDDTTKIPRGWLAYFNSICPPPGRAAANPCAKLDSLEGIFDDLQSEVKAAVAAVRAKQLMGILRSDARSLRRGMSECKDARTYVEKLGDFVRVMDKIGRQNTEYKIKIIRNTDIEYLQLGLYDGDDQRVLRNARGDLFDWVRVDDREPEYYFKWTRKKQIRVLKKVANNDEPICNLYTKEDLIKFALGGCNPLGADIIEVYINMDGWKRIRDLLEL
jgi:hypothetical protein